VTSMSDTAGKFYGYVLISFPAGVKMHKPLADVQGEKKTK